MAYESMGMAVGMMVGIFIFTIFYLMIDKIEANNFKTYFQKCDDKKKLEINISLDKIYREYNELAENTNTKVMKRKSNSVSNFINELIKYRLN